MDAAPSPLPLPSPSVARIDERNCKLFGPVSIVTQLLLGVVVLGSLLYKRYRERPRRAWRVWMMDVSKQLTGQLIVHMMNVLFSAVGTLQDGGNPCSLYFLNIALDTTLGIVIIFHVLKQLTYLFTNVWHLPGFVSGDYFDAQDHGQTPSVASRWLRQTGLYVISLIIMKLCVLLLLSILPFLTSFGNWLLGLFGTHRATQVVFVMALFPMAMNMLQFWLIDSILQYKPSNDYQGIPTTVDRDHHMLTDQSSVS
ncbi:hypothetical protein ACI68E_000853 [Malassezia pachydermatis]|uniref:Vacuolar membrane protein n=1 Tax=Malassezia pachydermatis TaxID=77020 RepID=A0A0M8MNN8_9BASI|nr:hypothetical protein Malapachy_2652 [Malassezia pachydermatis]KOS15228.1 hypothetical protein Malapachy_2652 [Malassezia pachydermatis]